MHKEIQFNKLDCSKGLGHHYLELDFVQMLATTFGRGSAFEATSAASRTT